MVVPPVHAWAAVPSPQLTVRVTLFTGPSSVRQVWVMVPVRSTHETANAPLGALRSATSWVTEAAGPERVLYGVTVSADLGDAGEVHRRRPGGHADRVAGEGGARGRVGERDDVRRGVGGRGPARADGEVVGGLGQRHGQVGHRAGLHRRLGLDGCRERGDRQGRDGGGGGQHRERTQQSCRHVFPPVETTQGEPPWRPARVEDVSGLVRQNPRNRTSGQYHPRPCLKDNAEHGLPYRSRM